MLLSAFTPSPLSYQLVQKLADLGIMTSTDLLFSKVSSVETYARIEPKIISFTDFEESIAAVAENLSLQGEHLSGPADESPSFVMETYPALDRQLGGGIPSGRVIELSGDKGSGKSVSGMWFSKCKSLMPQYHSSCFSVWSQGSSSQTPSMPSYGSTALVTFLSKEPSILWRHLCRSGLPSNICHTAYIFA